MQTFNLILIHKGSLLIDFVMEKQHDVFKIRNKKEK